MRADGSAGGREYHLYSAATAADKDGHINVTPLTPLTDLIVANVARSTAGAYFQGGNFSGVTPQKLKTQADALTARLLPILGAVGVPQPVDLLRASFSPNHTGLDAALDLIRISTDPVAKPRGALPLKNKQGRTTVRPCPIPSLPSPDFRT